MGGVNARGAGVGGLVGCAWLAARRRAPQLGGSLGGSAVPAMRESSGRLSGAEVHGAGRRGCFLVAVVAALLGLGGSTASAAVTIGGNVSPAGGLGGGTFYCGSSDPCTIGQIAGPGAPAPIDGVVVRWRIVGGGSAGLRILRPLGSGLYTGVGTGPMQTLAPSPAVSAFAVRLAIRTGDQIGVANPGAIANDVRFAAAPPPGAMQGAWLPPLGDGSPGRAPNTGFVSSDQLALEADVEADADGDGFGDESQDACPGIPGSVAGCPRADLGIVKSVSQDPGAVGNVTYTLVVGNAGPDAVPGVGVSDSLPGGQTLLSASSTRGACSGGPAVSCSLGALPSGGFAVVTLVVKAKAGTATNTATVSSATLAQAASRAAGAGDPNGANNSASATVTVAAPAVSGVSASPSRFRLGSLLPKLAKLAPVGTKIKFTLSEAATTNLEFLQSRPGRKVGKRCKTPTRANRNKKHCTRTVVAGRLRVFGRAGKNKLRFQGRLSSHSKLTPGGYTVRVTATDAAGNASKSMATTILIVGG